MSKHTPGPWSEDGYGRIVDANNRFVAVDIRPSPRFTTDEMTDLNEPERMANIRLITAAPDLLAAVKAVSNACCSKEDLGDAVDTDTVTVELSVRQMRVVWAALRKVAGG